MTPATLRSRDDHAHRGGRDYESIRKAIVSGEFGPKSEPDLGMPN